MVAPPAAAWYTLPLCKLWFTAIQSGTKRTEYRRCSDHWSTRLLNRTTPILAVKFINGMNPANGVCAFRVTSIGKRAVLDTKPGDIPAVGSAEFKTLFGNDMELIAVDLGEPIHTDHIPVSCASKRTADVTPAKQPAKKQRLAAAPGTPAARTPGADRCLPTTPGIAAPRTPCTPRRIPTTPCATAPGTPGTPHRTIEAMLGVIHSPPPCVSMQGCVEEYIDRLSAGQIVRLTTGLSNIKTIGTMCSGTDAPVAVLNAIAKVGGVQVWVRECV